MPYSSRDQRRIYARQYMADKRARERQEKNGTNGREEGLTTHLVKPVKPDLPLGAVPYHPTKAQQRAAHQPIQRPADYEALRSFIDEKQRLEWLEARQDVQEERLAELERLTRLHQDTREFGEYTQTPYHAHLADHYVGYTGVYGDADPDLDDLLQER